jgi:hypothetical protein
LFFKKSGRHNGVGGRRQSVVFSGQRQPAGLVYQEEFAGWFSPAPFIEWEQSAIQFGYANEPDTGFDPGGEKVAVVLPSCTGNRSENRRAVLLPGSYGLPAQRGYESGIMNYEL